MKYVRYSKYSPEAAGDVDMQELMSRLSDFFLQSGFDSQYGVYELDMERSREEYLEALRQAILRALEEGDLVPPEMMDRLLQNPDISQNEELRDLIDQLIQRMEQEGFIRQQENARVTPPPAETPGGQIGNDQPRVEAGFDDGDRIGRNLEAIRIRRHLEHGHQRDAVQCRAEKRPGLAHRTRLSRSNGPPVRISELMRDGADARLQPQHDSLRRRPVHAGKACRAGAFASDSDSVSRRFAALRVVP